MTSKKTHSKKPPHFTVSATISGRRLEIDLQRSRVEIDNLHFKCPALWWLKTLIPSNRMHNEQSCYDVAHRYPKCVPDSVISFNSQIKQITHSVNVWLNACLQFKVQPFDIDKLQYTFCKVIISKDQNKHCSISGFSFCTILRVSL